MSVLCEMCNVSKTYYVGEQVTPIHNLNLKIHKGQFISVTGDSGIGKSTLLMLAGGMVTPTEGSVLFEDQDYWKMKDSERTCLRREKIGFLFQSIQLVQALTIKENLELVWKMTGNRGNKEKIDYVLEDLGLQEKRDSLPYQLSGGQKRRAAMAVVYIKNPSLILADEPTNDLDKHWSEKIMSIFKNWVSEGKTVVMVTHNSLLARQADKCYEIRNKILVEKSEFYL